MDKNYNVDDILSEIKSRKSREKAGAAPPQGSSPPPPKSTAPPPVPPGADADFAPPTPSVQQEFQFDADAPQQQSRHNPMDFTGHVRPITDRARMRPGRLGQPPRPPAPAQPQFQFHPVEDPPAGAPPTPEVSSDTTQVDFSAFKPPEADGHTRQHTRVLPDFPTGKDVDLEQLRRNSSARTRLGMEESYYEDEEEYLQDGISESGSVDFSEYNSVGDRRDVATDIARVKLWLFIRGVATALLTFFLFWFTLSGKYPALALPPALYPEPETMRMYMLACTLLSALVAIVNSSAVGGGLISLFHMRANSDTLATLALLAAIAQGVAGIAKPETVQPEALNLYFCVAALAMLFGVLGKMTMINRIQTNFRILASDKKKKALQAVTKDTFCREFLPDAIRRPTITYAVPADFFTDFLGLSYSDKYDVGIYRSVAPVCLLGAVVVGVGSYLLTEDMGAAVSALTAILCISATLSATFIENIPLGKLTKKLAPMGGMVSGNKAVEDFCDTAAIVLTESDLFPAGNIRLRGIKSFSQGRIDESILDAASVICTLEGALSPVFLQMIGGNRALLKKVDNIVYENGMGISAWVDSRRVLIGNRRLMQNHGIQLPPDAARSGYTSAPEDGELIYLSTSGELSAQFAVSYHIDEELAAQLDLLAAREILLIIHTTDANITPHRLWELYGYPEELIRILPAERQGEFRDMSAPRENAIAEIVYTGRASTFVASILACINARSSILSATVIQLIQIVLGYGLVAFMAFMGAIGSLSITQLCIYQLFWFCAIFIVQKAKQP